MNHKRNRIVIPLLSWAAALLLCVLLAACGRGDTGTSSGLTSLRPDSDPPTDQTSPKTGPRPAQSALAGTTLPAGSGEAAPTAPVTGQPGATDGQTADTTVPAAQQTDPSRTTASGQSSQTAPSSKPTRPVQTATKPQTEQKPPETTEPKPVAPPDTDPRPKDEMVRVKDIIPDIHVDLRYAGTDNVAGMPIYRYSDAYLRYGTVKKLAKVQKALSGQGLSLLIWDAYRPLDAQYALSVYLPDYGTSPVSGKTAFNYGGTLSLAIVKADGSAVPLPSDFDAEGKKSDRDFSDLSAQAAKYGKLLDDLMRQNGFERYLSKWYRYTDSADYSLITGSTIGPEGITPCDEWITNCSETVNVRQGPSTSYSSIAKLKNGVSVKVAYFHEKFAFVTYGGGSTGYISAAYLRRPDDLSYEKQLSAVKVVEKYTYDMMQEDLAELAKRYPGRLTVTSIGKSEEGQDLTLAVLGNPDAPKKIFVSAGIHAREHMNCTLVMAQIDYMLGHPDTPVGTDGMTVGDLLDKVCFHILPMSNPDGIRISQTGVVPDMFKGQYTGATAALWKANAKGVDLNANFDADWERYGGADAPTSPGYMGYKGTAPECAAESKAIAEYVRSVRFDLVLSYHCTGSVIYWHYGSNTAVNNRNNELARRLAMTSGFTLGSPSPNSTAGLKDYVIDKLGIPSLTIEFGTSECPMNIREFSNLWGRCRDTLLTSAEWVLEK